MFRQEDLSRGFTQSIEVMSVAMAERLLYLESEASQVATQNSNCGK